MAKLTPRQAAFIRHLITGMSATEAARKAGYSDTYANREAAKLVVKPQVAAELIRLREKVDEKAIVTVQDVLTGLRREAENNEEGSSHAARVAAWAHIGKHLGMFTDKQEHSGDIRIRIIRE